MLAIVHPCNCTLAARLALDRTREAKNRLTTEVSQHQIVPV